MKKLSIMLFVTLFSINSYANDNLGIYLGLGTGFTVGDVKTKYNEDYKLPNLSETKNSINLFAGYNILPYLAVEAEYNHGLNKSVSSTNEYDEELKNKYSNQSFFANIVGKYPILEKHIPFIKFGIGYANYKNEYTEVVDGKTPGVKDEYRYDYTGKGMSYKFGAGYEFAITKNHSLVAEYNYVMTPKVNVTEKDVTDGGDDWKINNAAKVNYSTINVAYKFTF